MAKIYAQVVDRESRDATIKSVKGFSGVETIQTVYERYKIVVLSQSDTVTPELCSWARLKTVNSGLGGFVSFDPIVARGSFVTVEEDDNGDWVIDEVLPSIIFDEDFPSNVMKLVDDPSNGTKRLDKHYFAKLSMGMFVNGINKPDDIVPYVKETMSKIT